MASFPRTRKKKRSKGVNIGLDRAEKSKPSIAQIEAEGLRWINIEEPGPLEHAWLREHFQFHELDHEDVASRNQRPKIDEYDDYLFVVLHFPLFDKKVGRLNAGELDLFMGADFVITIPNQKLPPVEYLFEQCNSKEDLRRQYFSKGPGYLLYNILDRSINHCFPMLAKIGGKLEALEEDILEGRTRELVLDISNAKQEIINFRKIIRPERTVISDLEKTKQRYLSEEMEIYFDDIVDAAERIWDLLENYKEVVEALESTNESLIGHRVNDILRVLTSFSVVVLPLTLIASIWGMNVGLPGGGSDGAFWAIVVAMFVLLVGMLSYFRHRKWL